MLLYIHGRKDGPYPFLNSQILEDTKQKTCGQGSSQRNTMARILVCQRKCVLLQWGFTRSGAEKRRRTHVRIRPV